MADLSGNLAFLSPRDLFLLLGNRRSSGILTLRNENVEKHLAVREGSVVRASSKDPREFLGQILIHWGHLSDAAFHQAYVLHRRESLPMSEILVREGMVPEPIVLAAIERKITETALELYSWREGRFSFSEGEPKQSTGAASVVAIPFSELARRGEERVREWKAIRQAIPAGNLRLAIAGGAPPEVEPNTLDARIIRLLLEEPRTVDDLVLELHALEFLIYQRLWHLLRQGKLEVVGGGVARQPAESPPSAGEGATSAAGLLEEARAALAAKRAEQAVELATRAVEVATTAEALSVLQAAEKELVERLRKELLGTPSKPRVLLERARIRAMPLRPPERYLLGRMDGTRDLAGLVKVSPLREIDSLRLIRRLADEGLIRF